MISTTWCSYHQQLLATRFNCAKIYFYGRKFSFRFNYYVEINCKWRFVPQQQMFIHHPISSLIAFVIGGLQSRALNISCLEYCECRWIPICESNVCDERHLLPDHNDPNQASASSCSAMRALSCELHLDTPLQDVRFQFSSFSVHSDVGCSREMLAYLSAHCLDADIDCLRVYQACNKVYM